MIKLLIGGSPCTYWSIAQKNNRETEPSGLGWELFKNYLIAKEKFKPDFFLYENNVSASAQIKERIRQEFCVGVSNAQYIEINSALVAAQNRQRFYVHNCGDVKQPCDRNVFLTDILITPPLDAEVKNVGECKTIQKAIPKLVDKYGYLPEMFNAYNVSEILGKSPTLSTGSMVTSSCATTVFTRTHTPVYRVKNGLIKIDDKYYPTKLAEGYYYMRQLSVAESCRLQTLSDTYCRAIPEGQARKCIGNGWTADIIIHILGNALNRVDKNEQIVVLSMYDGIATGRYCLDKMGFTNVKYYAYEIDKFAIRVAQSNYPDIIQCGDAFDLRSDAWELREVKHD